MVDTRDHFGVHIVQMAKQNSTLMYAASEGHGKSKADHHPNVGMPSLLYLHGSLVGLRTLILTSQMHTIKDVLTP
jgi:hypothetical protein